MVKQNRKTRILGQVGVVAFLAVLAASAAFAMNPDGRPGDRPRRQREARRLGQISGMDIFGQNYGASDWSRVTSEIVAHPEAAGNPAIFSIPLSLGNVYLNRYETGHDKADLARAIQMFERVTSNYVLWGKRDGSAAVVSYLDISVSRLDAECDVGGSESRIDALWSAAKTITAEEAGALLTGNAQSILPITEEEDASRASLLAAAANFLGGDPRAGAWEQGARRFASRFSASACQTQETILGLTQGALAYFLVGRGDPVEFESVLRGASLTSPNCPQLQVNYETNGSVDVVAPGDSLNKAIADSRVVAYRLTVYLRLFPPGSQCTGDDGDDLEIDFRP